MIEGSRAQRVHWYNHERAVADGVNVGYDVYRITTEVTGQGATVEIKTLCLPLPPLVEQERIVAEVERRLSVVEQLDAVVAGNLQRATRLRQSILERVFSGRLVPDDGASHPGADDGIKEDDIARIKGGQS